MTTVEKRQIASEALPEISGGYGGLGLDVVQDLGGMVGAVRRNIAKAWLGLLLVAFGLSLGTVIYQRPLAMSVLLGVIAAALMTVWAIGNYE